MKLRISCCNRTILKKDLLRGAPLWGIYLLIWLAILPLNIFSSDWLTGENARELVLEAAVINSTVIAFGYGLAAACILFSWLYKARNANFFASLPVRRETMFLTNYVTGLLYCILPNLVVALLIMVSGGAAEADLMEAACTWFAMSTLGYIFYYSFAVLCAILVGHLVALPLLYGVLNFTAVVIEAIVVSLLHLFVYGMPSVSDLKLQWLSPLFDVLVQGRINVEYARINDLYQSVGISGWGYLLTLAAVGVAFALLAFLLFRKHRMEAAGDVIAVKALRPVFLYCFTAGCSLVIGWLLAALLSANMERASFLIVIVCMIFGAALGFFGGQMMLRKTLRVFGKGDWKRYGIVCCVVIAVMLCCRLDLFGYSRYVPKTEQVESVSVSWNEKSMVSDPQLIEQTIQFHQQLVDRRQEVERWNDGRITVYLNYKLKSGRMVSRVYEIPLKEGETSENLLVQYRDLRNDGRFLLAENTPPEAYTQQDIAYGDLWINEKQSRLTPEQTYKLLKQGIEKDLLASRLCTDDYASWISGTEEMASAGKEEVAVEERREAGLSVEFKWRLPNDGYSYDYFYYPLNDECLASWQVLAEMGLVEE